MYLGLSINILFMKNDSFLKSKLSSNLYFLAVSDLMNEEFRYGLKNSGVSNKSTTSSPPFVNL